MRPDEVGDAGDTVPGAMAVYRCPTCGNTVDTLEPGPPYCDEHDPGRWMKRVYRLPCPGSRTRAFGRERCLSCTEPVAIDENDKFVPHSYLTERP